MAQFLKIRGYSSKNTKVYPVLASALNYLMRYRWTNNQNWEGKGFKRTDYFKQLDTEPGLIAISARYLGKAVNVDIRPGLLAAVHHVCAGKNQKQADLFFDQIKSGENQKAGDVPFEVRSFMRIKSAKRPAPQAALVANLLVQAWNMHRAGLPCKPFTKFSQKCEELK